MSRWLRIAFLTNLWAFPDRRRPQVLLTRHVRPRSKALDLATEHTCAAPMRAMLEELQQ